MTIAAKWHALTAVVLVTLALSACRATTRTNGAKHAIVCHGAGDARDAIPGITTNGRFNMMARWVVPEPQHKQADVALPRPLVGLADAADDYQFFPDGRFVAAGNGVDWDGHYHVSPTGEVTVASSQFVTNPPHAIFQFEAATGALCKGIPFVLDAPLVLLARRAPAIAPTDP